MESEIIYNKLLEYAELEKCASNTDNSVLSNSNNLGFTNNIDAELNQNIQEMRNKQNNPSYKVLQKKPGFFGYIRYLFKRAIRKYTRFYVDPISLQQTQYNFATTAALENLSRKVSNLEVFCLEKAKEDSCKNNQIDFELKEYNERNKEIEEKLAQILEEKKQISSLLSDKVDALGQKIDLLSGTGIFDNITQNEWIRTTYAQSGEDVIISYILRVIGKQFQDVTYLDLGANHAKELSNTYALYCKGARGVLVEANPKLIPELKLNRSEDVIINKCVSDNSEGKLTFYVMSGDGLSTSDYESVKEVMERNPSISIAETIEIQSISVSDILENYFSEAPTVINIDIEGQEMNILYQLDFNKCRPTIIIIEVIEYSQFINKAQKNETILSFMKDKGYVEYAYTGINSIFVDEKIWERGEDTNENSI